MNSAGWSKLVLPHNMICIERKNKKEMDSEMGQDWVYGWSLGLPYPSLCFGTRDKESPIKFTNPGLNWIVCLI